jgi:hypothetical protein
MEATDDEQLVRRLEAIAARPHNEEALQRELETAVPAQARLTTMPSSERR